MTFTDEDIRAMVRAGEFSNSKDADYVADVLIERRDLIGRYWFSQSNPLDAFDVRGGTLTFEDLAVTYGFEQASGTTYHADIYGKKGRKHEKLSSLTSKGPEIKLDSNWLSRFDTLCISIKTSRAGAKPASPTVVVKIDQDGIAGISHQD